MEKNVNKNNRAFENRPTRKEVPVKPRDAWQYMMDQMDRITREERKLDWEELKQQKQNGEISSEEFKKRKQLLFSGYYKR